MRLPSRLEDERKSCVIPCLLFRQSPYFFSESRLSFPPAAAKRGAAGRP
jgi:hypothetical protein